MERLAEHTTTTVAAQIEDASVALLPTGADLTALIDWLAEQDFSDLLPSGRR